MSPCRPNILSEQISVASLDYLVGLVELFNAQGAVSVARIAQCNGVVFHASGPLPKDFCRWVEKKYRPKGPLQARTPYPVFYCQRRDHGFRLVWIVGTAQNARFYQIDLAQFVHLCCLAAEMSR